MTQQLRCTREQLLAAEAAYNVHAEEHGFPMAMLVPLEPALDAALALLRHPWKPEAPKGLELLTDTGLSRTEALEKAQAIVDGWATSQPARASSIGGTVGYSMDDRTTAVLRLAAFLTGTAGEV